MSRIIELSKIIRNTEVTVFATNFDGDPSVGISYGPEEVYAKDSDGTNFELTGEEIEKLGIEATEVYENDDWDWNY